MKTVKGNLITLAKNGEFDVIVHGCNCFNSWGAGIAVNIKQEFPRAYRADMKTVKGDTGKLGNVTFAIIDQYNLIVVNGYTQYRYGRGMHANYNAIESVMKKVSELYPTLRIGIPKIGAGLAGGDWDIISEIIDENLKNVTYVEYDNS